jgi:hypothetical protein
MDISEYYADRQTCIDELQLARKVFTNVNSTLDEWEGVERALGFMYLYCPENLRVMVHATLSELNKRKMMLQIAGKLELET